MHLRNEVFDRPAGQPCLERQEQEKREPEQQTCQRGVGLFQLKHQYLRFSEKSQAERAQQLRPDGITGC